MTARLKRAQGLSEVYRPLIQPAYDLVGNHDASLTSRFKSTTLRLQLRGLILRKSLMVPELEWKVRTAKFYRTIGVITPGSNDIRIYLYDRTIAKKLKAQSKRLFTELRSKQSKIQNEFRSEAEIMRSAAYWGNVFAPSNFPPQKQHVNS